MTAPAPPQQAPPGQQAPQEPLTPAVEAMLVTTVAGQLLTAVSAAAALAAIVGQFRLRLDMQQALAGALGIAMSSPPPVTGIVGPASEQTSRQNLARRAQFVVSSAKRLMSDLAAWRAGHAGPEPSPPGPVPGPAAAQAADLNVLRRGQFAEARRRRLQGDIDAAENAGRVRALQDGLARERRYYGLHLAAMWQRATAAGKTDMAALEHGRLLGWYTVTGDGKTSAACLAADRHNFYADRMPDIGWPGGGPHPNCRCWAGPAWPGAPLLPSRGGAELAARAA